MISKNSWRMKHIAAIFAYCKNPDSDLVTLCFLLRTYPQIAQETCYTFRILPKVEEKGDKSLLSCECETLGKAVCEAPRCMRRLTDGLELHWCVKTPSQAPVLECQLQYCTADFLSLWQDVPSVEIKVLDIKRAKESSDFREEIWQGIASKLKIATAYRFRVKSRNSVGWSEVSDPETCLTSEAPRAPNHLKLVTRSPGKVEVDFQFMDEEGCPVSHIEPEFCLKPESSGAGVLPGENGEGISNMFDPATWWWQTPGYFEVHVKEPGHCLQHFQFRRAFNIKFQLFGSTFSKKNLSVHGFGWTYRGQHVPRVSSCTSPHCSLIHSIYIYIITIIIIFIYPHMPISITKHLYAIMQVLSMNQSLQYTSFINFAVSCCIWSKVETPVAK